MTLPAPEGLTYQNVLQLLDMVRAAARFGSVDIQFGNTRIQVEATTPSGDNSRPAAAAPKMAQAQTETIDAPAIGHFRHAQDGIAPGRTLAAGARVGEIDTLGERTAVQAPLACMIAEILAPSDSFVEYGQPLLRVVGIKSPG